MLELPADRPGIPTPTGSLIDADNTPRWRSCHAQRYKADIRQPLKDLQNGQCVYCESWLVGSTKAQSEDVDERAPHIEHIRPQSVYPELRFTPSNLALSCSIEGVDRHCGHAKGAQVLPVEPGPGCNNGFLLLSSGVLTVSADNDERSKDLSATMSVLHLNHPSLVGRRARSVDKVVRLLADLADLDATGRQQAIDAFLRNSAASNYLRTLLT